jgi:2-deoxy-D-gluconate 3-dehydrogenase
MQLTLDGRAALITGGSKGLGLAMAKAFAEAGGHVAIVARGQAALDEAAAAIRATAPQAKVAAIAADVGTAEGCAAAFAAAEQALGRVDILVNNAGTSIRKMPQDFTEEEWHHVLDTNLTSAFLCSQVAYHAMVKVGGGKMINIGSMMSLFGAPYATPYASSKGGIVQMTRALATAWARDNIQVNAVLPGWIDTDLTKRARQQVQELHDSVEKRTPQGRWGVPSDLAGVTAFLASPASDFVTGTAIPVDGGFSIAM